jgi:hypothetical protein
MQDYPVVSGVPLVTVCLPVARFNMNFDITFDQPLPGDNNRVKQIRSLVIANPSRVDYPDRLTIFGGQIRFT